MTPTLARYGIVLISLLSLAAFLPGGYRWYRHRHDRTVACDRRFRVQHLSHVVMLIHHLFVVLLLVSIDPFFFLPGSDGRGWTGALYGFVTVGGLALFAVGNVIRIRAAYAMGQSFDKAVLIKAEHRLVTDGPFRFSRHPIYVGNLLAELGLGLSLGSWPLVMYTLLLSLPAWNHRAATEEALLTQHFGRDYVEYCEKVGRWWP